MRSHIRLKQLLGASSLALSVGAALAPAQPVSAQSGVYGGGSGSASLFMRQIFDCYDGSALPGDGYATTATFVSTPPSPGFIPSCPQVQPVVGLFAGVGSGRGQQAYLSDDPLQLVNGGAELTDDGQTLPGAPEFLDGASSATSLGVYPYPQLDFAASDAPLAGSYSGLSTTTFAYATATDWATVSSGGTINPDLAFSVGTIGTATYSSASFGPAIQLPLFAMPLAIDVNTAGLTVHSVNPTATTLAGGAMQLNIPQLCAIFSGTVTDWSSKAAIADHSTAGTEPFYAANTSKSSSATTQYATTATPIHVVYRKDDSGASYILTNFLKASCPQLDNGTNQYSAIFDASNLPSTSFAQLIFNVIVYGPGGTGAVSNWTGATGSSGVASLVGNSVGGGLAGAIGYVSADWTQPYRRAATSPSSASVQNAVQFNAKHNTPFSAAGFVAPTPTAANTAFAAVSPSNLNTVSTYNDWNVYNVTTTVAGASVSLLGFNATTGAYPLTGTTFLEVYGCYKTAARASAVTGFLNWYFNNNATTASAISNPVAAQVLTNNGFGQLPTSWMNAIYNEYLASSSANFISSADKTTKIGACSAVTGTGA